MSVELDIEAWHAYVKYKSGDTEVVPISSIKEKIIGHKKVRFTPRNLQDYEPSQWYSVLTTSGSLDGTVRKWYAQIGKLAESKESLEREIENGKHSVWPLVLADDSEPSTTGPEETNPEVSKQSIRAIRKKNKQSKHLKRDATDAPQAKLLHAKSVLIPDDKNSTTEAQMQLEIAQLKAKLKAAEEREERPKTSNAQEMTDILAQQVHALKKAIEDHHQETSKRIASMEKKVEEYISKCGRTASQHVLDWINKLPVTDTNK